MLSEAHLKEIHLWNHVSGIQISIHFPPTKLSLYILRLRHAIHLVYGESSLQPLTLEELSFAEEVMKECFKFLSAKEALANRRVEGNMKKRKLIKTYATDRATSGRLTPSGSGESSLQKASLVRRKSIVSDNEEVVTMTLPAMLQCTQTLLSLIRRSSHCFCQRII